MTEWRRTTLGEVAQVVGGGTPSTRIEEYWGGENTWLTPTEVVSRDGKVLTTSKRKITDAGLRSSSAKLLPEGAVLLTSRASVGFVALAGRPLATNQGFQSLIAGSSLIPRWLMYWAQANRLEFRSRASGSTFPEVSGKKVRAIPITVPPLDVQRRLADLVGSLDANIAALEAEIDSADALASSVAGTLTEHAAGVVSTLGEVTKVVGGGTPSTRIDDYWGGNNVWLTPTEVVRQDGEVITSSERTITDTGLKSSSAKLLPAGTVLLTSRASVGFVAIAGCELATNQGFQSLVAGDSVVPRWLMYWAQANRDEFRSRASGSTFAEVSGKKVRAIPITVPSVEEQRSIVSVVDPVVVLTSDLRVELDALHGLRASLLPLLLAGEVEIPVSYAELLELEMEVAA